MIPTGPIDEAPWEAIPREHGRTAERSLAAIREALEGVELGAYDLRMVEWLVSFGDVPTVATICSWLLRARAAGRTESGRSS